MDHSLITLQTYYKTLPTQLVFIMYLVSLRILANNLKDKLKDKPINKVFKKLFEIIILLVIYLNIAFSNIAIGLNGDLLGLLIAAIFIFYLILRLVQNREQLSFILKCVFEDKRLSKKILNYSGLWIFLTALALFKMLTAYWIILGFWIILLVIEIIGQYKHRDNIHNESCQ